jgi:hypothetical protein
MEGSANLLHFSPFGVMCSCVLGVTGMGMNARRMSLRDQVSHPYRTTGKIVALYILIFMFLDSSSEEGKFIK